MIYAKKNLILLFTFYKLVNDGRVYFYTVFREHPLFRSTDFWQCCIFDALKEKLHFLGSEQVKEDIVKQKNIVFSELASYTQDMAIFDIEREEAKAIIHKFSTFFDLLDMQLKNLYVRIPRVILEYVGQWLRREEMRILLITRNNLESSWLSPPPLSSELDRIKS